ncbi:MAG: HAD family hydrolase [Pirellulales bacterium]|nr:HAD family hydrolase [Pirellulales bacterium]
MPDLSPNDISEILRRHARPMEPIATGEEPRGGVLRGVKAVLFDLYGTVFVSGSGEVGTVAAPCDIALAEAADAVGLRLTCPAEEAVECFFETIRAAHAEDRRAGVEYPEVDVVAIWAQVLAEMVRRGGIDPDGVPSVDPARLAVEYEARANPVWPMPGAEDCLGKLRAKGFRLGIVSNAQFYTRRLFEALWNRSAEDVGFEPDLQFYSYEHGWGKPGLRLFELAVEALAARGIGPTEAVYVGNDVLNDILPAARLGFRTILFAGDVRSLRLREDDPRVEGITPDLTTIGLWELQERMIS